MIRRFLFFSFTCCCCALLGMDAAAESRQGNPIFFNTLFHQEKVPIINLKKETILGSVILEQGNFAFVNNSGVFGFALDGFQGTGINQLLTISDYSQDTGLFQNQVSWPFSPECTFYLPIALKRLQTIPDIESVSLTIDGTNVALAAFGAPHSWPEANEIVLHVKSRRIPAEILWTLSRFVILDNKVDSKIWLPTEIFCKLAVEAGKPLLPAGRWQLSNVRFAPGSSLSLTEIKKGYVPRFLTGDKPKQYDKVLFFTNGKLVPLGESSKTEPFTLVQMSVNLAKGAHQPLHNFQWISRYWPLWIGSCGFLLLMLSVLVSRLKKLIPLFK